MGAEPKVVVDNEITKASHSQKYKDTDMQTWVSTLCTCRKNDGDEGKYLELRFRMYFMKHFLVSKLC